MTEPAATTTFDESVLLSSVLATAPVGLGFLDHELRFVRVNEALANGNGASREDHIGRRIDEIWPGIPPEVFSRLERILLGGAPLTDFESRTTMGERERIVLASYYPVRDEDGTILGIGIVVVDVTARTQAESAARSLAREQAALRRVATLVASESDPEAVFECVTHEVAGLTGTSSAGLIRYDASSATVVGRWDATGLGGFPVGTTLPLVGEGAIVRVHETGLPARIDDYEAIQGPNAEAIRRSGYRSLVAAPIHVAGRLWGALVVGSEATEPLPSDLERRLHDFAELVALAVGNAEARAQATASRARIVEAGDAARRRLERNLHDGAQQRLVALSLLLRLAQSKLETDAASAAEILASADAELAQALEELRELARGLHPAVLSDRGLGAALEALAGRLPLPVAIEGRIAERLPEPVEAALYFVVAEALTNVAKYAEASSATVKFARGERYAEVEVVDDGVGGADESLGSGLLGLADRVEALGGQLEISSRPGEGTRIRATIPVRG